MTDTTDVQALREAMQTKLARKREIIDKLKGSNAAIEKLKTKLGSLPAVPRMERRVSPQRLEEQIDRMEFAIATSAYTPAQEKDLIRKLDIIRLEYDAAKKAMQVSGEGAVARSELEGARTQRRSLVSELQELRKEIDKIYQKLKSLDEQRASEAAERRAKRSERDEKKKVKQQEQSDIEPYMGDIDPFVSLEDIAEIKKKPKEEQEEPPAAASQQDEEENPSV